MALNTDHGKDMLQRNAMLSLTLLMIGIRAAIAPAVQLTFPFRLNSVSHDGHDDLLIAHKNQPLVLNCSVSSATDAPVLFSWRFESEDIGIADSRRQQRPDGSLFIKKFLFHRKSKKSNSTTGDPQLSRKNDEGRYFCIARTSAGAVFGPPIRVIGSRPPPAAKALQTIGLKAPLGSNIRLSCQTNSSAALPVFRWRRNNQLINSTERYRQLATGVLQVVNISLPDSGLILCEVVINSDVFPSKEWRIEPLSDSKDVLKVEILSPSLQLTHKAKESAVLECLTRSASDVSLVVWSRVSAQPLPDNWTIDESGNLHLTDLSLLDADNYVCNINSSTPVSQVHTLRVIYKPFITKIPHNMASPSSQTARLECAADGYPPPTVQWFKDAAAVSMGGRIETNVNDQSLVIAQTVPSDSGVYQCLAENEAGSATAAALLIITAVSDQPRPPVISALESVTATSVRLEIQVPEMDVSLSPIKAFTVHYTAVGGQELQYVSPNTSVLIDNLIPFTNYSFYVRAYGNSASEPSAISFVQTKADVPVRSPRIEVTAVSPTTVRVTWRPLPLSLARGLVNKYEVHCKKRSQSTYRVTEVADGSAMSHVIEDLQPGVKYDIRVLAGTWAGFPKVSEGPIWPWTSVEMPAIDQHILSQNFTDQEIDSTPLTTTSTTMKSLLSGDGKSTIRVPEQRQDLAGMTVVRLLIWIMAGSAMSAALVCLCIITLNCRRKSSAGRCEDRNGNCTFANGHLPAMYGEVTEGREMQSFLHSDATGHKSLETPVDRHKDGYASLSRHRKAKT